MNRFAGVAGRTVFAELSEAMESGVLFTRQHVIEAAGVGKLAIEYGSEVAAETMTTLKSNPELLRQAGKHPMQVMQETAECAKQWGQLNICDLKNIQHFKSSTLEHILEGELNARGKAVGFHYEGMPMAKGRVIQGTETAPNQFGVYTAHVEVNGVPKVSNGGKSSFFPKNWDAQKIVDSINEAFTNKQFVSGTRNTYVGELSNGMQIEMYIDATTNKIISAFPVK